MRLTKTINLTHGLLLTGLLLAFSLIFNSHATHAATITVTTTDTATSANDADCTLREAIENINTQTNAVNTDCAAGDGSTDTIIIPSGNITLEADLPGIATSMIIQGAGMGQTVIDGGGLYQGFWCSGSTGGEHFFIKQLTITAYDMGAVYSDSGDVTLEKLEVDGTGATNDGSFMMGILVGSGNTDDVFALTDVYVHDLAVGTVNSVFAIATLVSGSGNMSATLNRVTVSNIHAANAPVTAITAGVGILGGGTGTATAYVSNATVSNIHSSNNTAAGIGAVTFGTNEETNLSVQNATVTDVLGVDPGAGFGGGGAIFVATLAGDPGQHTRSSMTLTNSLILDGCVTADIGQVVIGPGAGTGIASITSQGGNLSDDASCSPYFTQQTDQNNVAGLAATLSPLADNGGNVPTMALRENSPAVDGGVTIAGLTQDARLAARPQGSAYDSGAYEYVPVASLASTGESITSILLAVTALLGLAGVAQLLRVNMLQ